MGNYGVSQGNIPNMQENYQNQINPNINPTQNHVQNQGMGNQNQGMPNQNQGIPNQNQGMPNQNQIIPNQNQGLPIQNQGIPNQNQGFPNQNQGIINQNKNKIQIESNPQISNSLKKISNLSLEEKKNLASQIKEKLLKQQQPINGLLFFLIILNFLIEQPKTEKITEQNLSNNEKVLLREINQIQQSNDPRKMQKLAKILQDNPNIRNILKNVIKN